jgi:hypothetical protein
MESDKFIFCLEAVPDVEQQQRTKAFQGLEQLAYQHGIDSIYETCDTIEGLQDSLNVLLYDDHNFTNYEIIYLVMHGEANNIRINDYYYSIEELAELFEGKMKRKIVHFANVKELDLSQEEAQYFLDVTGARAVSGYGAAFDTITSSKLDSVFFSLCQDQDSVVDIVEDLYAKQYNNCKLLDFRLYYNEQ